MSNPEQDKKTQEEQGKKMGQLIAKCWSDDGFKRKFLADPNATLKAEGLKMDLPAGMSIKAVENTDKMFHLVIPAKPTELSEEQLDMAAGGFPSWGYCFSTPAPAPVCWSLNNSLNNTSGCRITII